MHAVPAMLTACLAAAACCSCVSRGGCLTCKGCPAPPCLQDKPGATALVPADKQTLDFHEVCFQVRGSGGWCLCQASLESGTQHVNRRMSADYACIYRKCRCAETSGPHSCPCLNAPPLQYTDGAPVLRNVTFSVPGGSTVALVGATGSGKSTILRLLFRWAGAGCREGQGRDGEVRA